jgi:hypothetical protein
VQVRTIREHYQKLREYRMSDQYLVDLNTVMLSRVHADITPPWEEDE